MQKKAYVTVLVMIRCNALDLNTGGTDGSRPEPVCLSANVPGMEQNKKVCGAMYSLPFIECKTQK